MDNRSNLENELRKLPIEEKWEIAEALLRDLHDAALRPRSEPASTSSSKLPNYAARRKAIFGDKVLKNAVLDARELERW